MYHSKVALHPLINKVLRFSNILFFRIVTVLSQVFICNRGNQHHQYGIRTYVQWSPEITFFQRYTRPTVHE